MTDEELLAARLRQAIQGCTMHSHGPVQAWNAIEEANRAGLIDRALIVRLAVDACDARVAELRRQGISDGDVRIRKETITKSFILSLFR